MFPPARIVCLTEETTETLYLLGEQHRIVGISGYTVRPPQARKEKPRVSAFISADIPKILALEPDLVLTFSDLQAEIVAALIRAGISVHAFNQRTILGILDIIRTLGALIGASDRANALADRLAANLESTRRRNAERGERPKVYFEEWDDPMISGIGWVSELIAIAGGADIFSELAGCKSAKDGTHSARCGDRPRAGHHHRLVVRQEIQQGKGCRSAGLRRHSGCPEQQALRNQIRADPPARARRSDRWTSGAGKNHSRRFIGRGRRPTVLCLKYRHGYGCGSAARQVTGLPPRGDPLDWFPSGGRRYR